MLKKVFTLEDLKTISNYNTRKQTYNLDLSYIHIEDWEPLMNTIYEKGKTSIYGLGFNANTLDSDKKTRKNMIERSPKGAFHPPIELESSALVNFKGKIVPETVGLLSRVLPKTDTIQILKFKSLRFAYSDIDVLAQSIDQCTSLKEIKLRNISLRDKGFIRLASALMKQGVITLQCRNCKLTDAIKSTFIDLISRHTAIQREAERKAELEKDKTLGIICLSTIDFRENDLTRTFLDFVEDEVAASPMLRLDLRGNADIDETDVRSPKIVAGDARDSGRVSKLSDNAHTREAQLEMENEHLRQTLYELAGVTEVAVLRTGLYAVGERAAELAQHIDALDEMCSRMEHEVSLRPPQPAPKKKAKARTAKKPKRLVHHQYLK